MTRHFCALLLLCFLLFGINNTFNPPDIMESRNLVAAREMVSSGEWLIPTLNGELRLEKPPLPTWGAAVVEMLLPQNLAAQRLLSAFMAWLLVWFLYKAVETWSRSRRLAFRSALIFASCYSLMFMARNATWDIWAQTFCMGGIWLYIRALSGKGKSYASFFWAGLFFGLSFLSKGPVALYGLLLPFLLSYHLVARPSLVGKGKGVVLMLVTALIVGTWWYVYIVLSVRHAASGTWNKETTAWTSHNVRPWHYYKLFFLECGIWSVFWLTALLDGARRYWRSSNLRMAILWTLFALILLSLMPEKKTRYLLPMMAPCALTIAFYMEGLSKRGEWKALSRRLLQANVGIIVALLFAFSAGLAYYALRYDTVPIGLSVLMVVLLFALACFLARELMARYMSPQRIVAGYVGVMLIVSMLGIKMIGGIFLNPSYRGLCELRENASLREMPYIWSDKKMLRPEIMQQAARIIQIVPAGDEKAFSAHLPAVLLTSQPLDSLPQLRACQVEDLGEYDHNWSRSGSKRYHSYLRVHAYKVAPGP